ncbi:MAG: hypothetical protein ACSHXH_18355 [Marivita sp.]|uniref:hypothetical protein n=1 Tax=Marivita sp. TaxID=2003365 RepID=UPI003EF19019
MSLDPITEKISHFIGSFDMTIEQARMRDAYEEFRALLAEQAEAQRLELLSHQAKHGHKLKDFEPSQKITLPSDSIRSDDDVVGGPPEALGPLPTNDPLSIQGNGYDIPNVEFPGLALPLPIFYANFILPLPASVVTVTHQHATLFDNDTFGNVQFADFQPTAAILSSLNELADFAYSLSIISFEGLTQDTDWFEVVAEISETAGQVTSVDNGHVMVALFQTEEDVVLVNGEQAESLPEWEDIIPLYHALKRAEAEEEDAGEGENEEHDFSRDFEKEGSAAKYDDVNTEVVAGANTLVNSASIYSNWLDASVFAVAGDVLKFDAISQVNVLVDHDMGTGQFSSELGGSLQSQTINAASIRELSVVEAELEALEQSEAEEDASEIESPRADEDDPPDGAQTASDDGGNDEKKVNEPLKSGQSPSNWAVVRYDGDVTQINFAKQYTFSSDMDQAVLSFGATTTFLGLGENLITNSFNSAQFGYGFDLIVIGGNMVEINLIDQVNVMLDSDLFMPKDTVQTPETVSDANGEVPISGLLSGVETIGQSTMTDSISMESAPAVDEEDAGPEAFHARATKTTATDDGHEKASDKTATAADSILENQGSNEPTEQSANLEFAETKDLSTEGSETTAVEIEPLKLDTGSGSESLGSEKSDPAPRQDEPEQIAAPPGLSTSDNLLYNKASIEKIGEDTDAEISETFISALQKFAEGSDEVDEDLVQDDLFLGTELLKVLYVDGDFTTANILSQSNILGDSDQIQMAHDHFAAALQKEIQITTGSNIEANFASIKNKGQDSVVMAKGTTYSDALIHQANLVDTNSQADAAMGIAELASEAVAFLADGLIGPDLAKEIVASAHDTVTDSAAQALGTEAVLT